MGHIRPVHTSDAKAICRIYNYYVEHTIITFQETPSTVDDMAERIETLKKTFPWLVYEDDGQVVGYAYVTAWGGKSAYRFCVENTIYMDKDRIGRGEGTQLFEALLKKLDPVQIHTIIARLGLPNEASVRLHEKFGFEKAGHIREAGYKFDRWVDMGFWQLLLSEYRAKSIK